MTGPTAPPPHRREDHLAALQGALLALSRDAVRGDADAAVRRMTEATARALGVARVSVWRYTPDRRVIRCSDLYEAAAERHSAGPELTADAYPAYFRALEASEVITATDAAADPRTRELAADYLAPHGIGALLDVPLHPFGRLEGVLSCEHIGPSREWGADERVFAVAVGNLVSLAQERWERERTEDELRRSQALFRAFMDNTPAIAFIKDADGRYAYANRRWEEQFDPPRRDWAGKSDADFWPPETAALFRASDRAALEPGQSLEVQEAVAAGTGDTRHFLALKFPVEGPGGDRGVGGVVLDVTEKARLEGQLRQAQKMEAVGRLAGGVAHDFNNLLTVITGYASLLLDALPPGDPNRVLVEEVRTAGDRATDLTRQLLAYGRKQILRPRVLDLGALAADLGALLRRLIGEDVELVLDAAPVRVAADPGQLSQVLMNLAVNARDAMPRGGQLTVRTRSVELGAGATADGAVVPAGAYAVLEVADTGCGMTDDVKARAFEPFFTTKGVGEGTGLGLATVYGIVKQSGGHVGIESAVGQGTTVRVHLPAAEPVVPAPTPRLADPATAARGSEAVLLVEDDDDVRGLAGRVLRAAGYAVTDAASGAAALAAAAGGMAIDLLVTDVVMPGMGGRELADRLTAARPGLRVLFVSGYTDDAVLRHGVEGAAVHFLPKPFSPATLARKVREVLDAGR